METILWKFWYGPRLLHHYEGSILPQFDGNYISEKFDGNYTSEKSDGNYTLEKFDGNYTLEILVWATSLYHYEGPEGWEEPGIDRKPSFTRLSVAKSRKRRAPSEDGDGVPPPINRGNGSPWYALTEKRPPSQAKASFFVIERSEMSKKDELRAKSRWWWPEPAPPSHTYSFSLS